MQLDLIPVQPRTRAAARRQALELAQRRAERGQMQAESTVERASPGWVEAAIDKLANFARAQGGVFTVEMAREQIAPMLPPCPELRVWGRVTQLAARRGLIEPVPRVLLPACSSNGCLKPAWRAKR